MTRDVVVSTCRDSAGRRSIWCAVVLRRRATTDRRRIHELNPLDPDYNFAHAACLCVDHARTILSSGPDQGNSSRQYIYVQLHYEVTIHITAESIWVVAHDLEAEPSVKG